MSKFLSLEWFKSKIEHSVENVISKKIEDLIEKANEEEGDDSPSLQMYEKPYKNVKLVNDTLTVVLHDGAVLSKPSATQNDFKDVREASCLDDVFKVMISLEGIIEKNAKEAELQRLKVLSKAVDLLVETGDFQVSEGSVYMNGIKRSLPQLLIEKFAQVIYDNSQEHIDYQSLKKFWMKCCLNPNAQSAEDLYEFLANHQFKIDKHGNFYAYRRVVSKNTDNQQLVEFVSNTYTKVKGVWKKRPADFYVIRYDDGFKIEKNQQGNHAGEFIGDLEELYLDLPNIQKNMYTSSHTGSEDYRVGEIISMPRYEGNDDNSVSCSRGFHAASKAYDYTEFGNTPILVIINPMDVLAVPMGEVGKLRTCRWFFASILDESEKHILDDVEFDVTELGDVFEDKCLEDMKEYVQVRFAEEVLRHTFTLPTLSAIEVNRIVTSLEDMKAILSGRVIERYDEDDEDEVIEIEYCDDDEDDDFYDYEDDDEEEDKV